MSSSPSEASSESAEGAAHSDNTSVDGTPEVQLKPALQLNSPRLLERFGGIFAESAVAKITRTAVGALVDNDPPTRYPEYVPQTGEDAGQYALREADFWTCGFFPGCIYLLLERFIKFPHTVPALPAVQATLEKTTSSWDGPIRAMAGRTDTHDMAFIVMLSQRARYELYNDARAKEAVVTAARALHSRYHPRVGAIRSWDVLNQNGVQIRSLTEDFLVIIDSMINLELLYYAAGLTGDETLATAATSHADAILRSVVRDESKANSDAPLFSTFHVANFSPITGEIKELRTAQGYARNSTWARGQAWGILGFARTFLRTGEARFARASAGLANYFLMRLDSAPACVEVPGCHGPRHGRYVPLWDFDAPIDPEAVAETGPLRDSSAGVIAANGMLVLSQALRSMDPAAADRYLQAAFDIVDDTLALSLATETAEFVSTEGGVKVQDTQAGRTFASILKHATANANARDHHRYWNHGLVYADYYLLEFGNNLLRMGLA
ncbi:hypothetical protein SEUCBS139899_010477 [Sporothrix eucalyptigena]|uniref:Glucuronyl hydrolase n=1 Tax=Sporothrix eucalyptigena TaxID=1812306 RepID=A0ABP0D0U4_9PEZI